MDEIANCLRYNMCELEIFTFKAFHYKNLAIRVSLPYHIRKWSSSPIRQLCGFYFYCGIATAR
jgi:hypothetical protein